MENAWWWPLWLVVLRGPPRRHLPATAAAADEVAELRRRLAQAEAERDRAQGAAGAAAQQLNINMIATRGARRGALVELERS